MSYSSYGYRGNTPSSYYNNSSYSNNNNNNNNSSSNNVTTIRQPPQIKTKEENQNPLDTVKQIVFHKFSNNVNQSFLTCGWDGIIRHYSIINQKQIIKNWEFSAQHPVLSIDVAPNNIVVAGLATGSVIVIGMSNNQMIQLGRHNAPICKVFWMQKFSMVMSFGYDNQICFWTLQQNNGSYQAAKFTLPVKTHTAAYDHPYVLIGGCNQDFIILNVDNLSNLKIPDAYFKSSSSNNQRSYGSTNNNNNNGNNINGVGDFSKFNCSSIQSHPQMRINLGTVDGRNLFGEFKQYNGQITIASSKISKVQKKQSSSSSYRSYSNTSKGSLGQVNDCQLGNFNGQTFLFVCGTYEAAIFNMNSSSKAMDIDKQNTSSSKMPITSGKFSPNYQWLVYATGTDWAYGLQQSLQKMKRPKIVACRFQRKHMQCFTLKQNNNNQSNNNYYNR